MENYIVDAEIDADDPVNHPAHYSGKVECIDALESALGSEGFLAFCRGNAMKYLWRCMRKGATRQDLEKAKWYIDRALKCLD